MRTISLTLGFLALTAAAPAVAQDAGRAPGNGNVVPPSSLGAYLHHQPNAKDVEQRELDSGKKIDDKRQRRQQSDVDELYDEVMRNSAPSQQAKPLPK